MKSLGLVLLCAGCGFQSGPPQVVPADGAAIDGAGSGSDAALDAMVIPPDARLCFGALVNVCLSSLPSGAVSFSGSLPPLDTGIDANCPLIVPQAGGPSLCVHAGRTVTVATSLVAVGARPLVLIGTEAVTVPGVIDASSTLAGRRGAGANTGGCATTGITGANDTGGAGGGAGGSFGIAGGKGGVGDTNTNGPPTGAASGGTAGQAIAPTALRGGCAGGKGGDFDATRRGGAGGAGGGAIYLIAGATITIAGDVFASGAGGGATPTAAGIETGGGGGGAGGMIVLDAPAIDVPGRVVANGGAGGGGGGLDSGGMPGGDGTTINWNARATAGAAADLDGGTGAAGSALGATGDLAGVDDEGGGGGGAGGLGLVWFYGALQGGTRISPAPTQR